jgi:hypothetical protein
MADHVLGGTITILCIAVSVASMSIAQGGGN